MTTNSNAHNSQATAGKITTTLAKINNPIMEETMTITINKVRKDHTEEDTKVAIEVEAIEEGTEETITTTTAKETIEADTETASND